jgi:hypothetical protein
MSAPAKAIRRGFGLALAALGAVALCLAALAPTTAGARDLEVPTFLAPGRNSDLSPSIVPGGRPFEVASVFALNQTPVLEGIAGPAENVRDLSFELPPGLVANAATFTRCAAEAFSAQGCATATQVGVASLDLAGAGEGDEVPVFNIAPPPGMAAQFAFRAPAGSAVHIDFRFRGGTDYGATAQVRGASAAAALVGSSLSIWGVPGDPGHDALRFAGNGTPAPGPYPEPPPYRPLISNPTSCNGPMVTTMEASSWQLPGKTTSAAAFEAPGMSNCNQLDFSPGLGAKPTTNLADSPSGLDFALHVPQNQDPDGSAVSHLRTARITLPPGLSLNPAAAGGLGACSPAQIGYLGSSNERQILRYEIPPVGFSGTFTVTAAGKSTAQIPANASAAVVRAAIETLPGLAGNVSVAAAPGGWLVSFGGALAGTNVPQLGGTITDNPAQLIAVTAQGGTYRLSFGGTETAPLPFDASAAEIRQALRAIPALGLGNLFPGNVFVFEGGSEESTRFYQAIFAGDLIGTVPALGATSALTGPAAGVEITPQQAPSPRPLSVATLGGNAPGTAQFDGAPAACPDASKVGTLRVDAPALVDHPLFGSLYLASQGQNPFGSLLGLYAVIEDDASGLVAKLAGRVDVDGAGRLLVTFPEAPQLPFEDLRVELFKGAAAPLKTGVACGTYAVETELVPWSAPEAALARPKDSFKISQGAGGAPCVAAEAAAPVLQRFEAGTIEPTAGAYSSFALKLTRPDGSRQLGAIDTTLPAGLLAKLAGRQPCPEAALAAAAAKSGRQEQAAPSCPPASRVGSLDISAGAGPVPYDLTGSAYLTGPYKGASFSLATITPALAGPFDLGTVINRAALYLDPKSTRVHVVSDPFPQTLQGIGTDLRSVALSLDAPAFVKNPTSCNPLALDGALGARFQVGDCSRLAFAPKLELAALGPAKRGAHPTLKATLTPGKGNPANLAALSVALPKALGLDKARIKAICSAAQLSACPSASAYGAAKVQTPLLADPLQGPVYLRKAGKLTELAIDLRSGPLNVVLAGRLTTTKAGVVSVSFTGLPDVPISRFSLEMPGARRGLFKASANLCVRPPKASVQIDGQNAASADQSPVLTANCKKAAKGGKGAAKKKGKG